MINFKKYFLAAGVLIWGALVIKYFIDSHIVYQFWTDYSENPGLQKFLGDGVNNFSKSLPTFILSLFLSSGMLYFLRQKLNPFWGLGVFLVNTFVIFLFHGFWTDFMAQMVSFKILFTLIFMTLGAAFFTIFLIFIGDLLAKLLPNRYINLIENFFGGFVGISFLGFVLGKVGFFDIKVFLFILAVCVFCWESLWKIICQIKEVRLPDYKQLSFIQILLGALVLTVLGLNILQTFFPFSLAWDSSNMYLLTVNDLIETGELRTGIFPPFTEIVMSIGGLFLGLGFVQFLYNFWGTLFLIVSGFVLTKQVNPKASNNVILLLITAFFLIPAVQFQLSSDLKIDILFLSTILVGTSLLLKKYDRLACLLFGFAVLQKVTAVFFWPVVLVALFLNKEKVVKIKIQAVVLLLAPFSVWGMINLIEVGVVPNSLAQMRGIVLKGKIQTPQFDFGKLVKDPVAVLPAEKVKPAAPKKEIPAVKTEKVESKKTETLKGNTWFAEEVERYVGHETNFFKKVWAVFTSPKIPKYNKRYVDLGFLFVVVLPILVIFAYKLYRNLVFWMMVVFFLAWILVLQGGAWYGFPAVILMLILSLKCFDKEKIWRGELIAFLVFSMIFGLYSRLFNFPAFVGHASLMWANSPNKETSDHLAKTFFTEELAAAKFINESDKNLFIVGTMAKFWIDNLDERTYDDPQLDIFNKILDENNSQNTINFLKEHDFQFILYDRYSKTIETDGKGTLNNKVDKFEKFAVENLKIAFMGKKVALYEVR